MNRFDNGKLLRRWKLGLVAWFLWEPEGFFITPKRTSDAPNGWGPPRTEWDTLALINPPYGTPSPSGDFQSEPVLINRFEFNKYPDGGATYADGKWTLPDGTTTVLDIAIAPIKWEAYEKPGIYAPTREEWRSETNPNFIAQPIETETGTWYAHWPEDMVFRNDVDKAIFIESNAERVAVGENPVNPTPRGLGNTAYYAAYQGHKHNSIAHDDWVRYDEGYQYVAERGWKEGLINWGENLLLLPSTTTITPLAGETDDYALGRTLVETWVLSPEHYNNMIHSDWTTYPEGTYPGFAYVDVAHWKNTTIEWKQEPPYTSEPVAVDPPDIGTYGAQLFRLIPATITALDSVWEGAAGRVSWAAPAFRYFKFGKDGWRTNASFNVEYICVQGRIIATPPSRTVLGACVLDRDVTEDVNGTPTTVSVRYVRLALLTDAPYTIEFRLARLSDMITAGYGPNSPDDVYVFEAGYSLTNDTNIIQVSKVLFNSIGSNALFYLIRRTAPVDNVLDSGQTDWNTTIQSTYARGLHKREYYTFVITGAPQLFEIPNGAVNGSATASSFEDPPGTEKSTYDLTINVTTPLFYDFEIGTDAIIHADITVNDTVTYEVTDGFQSINSITLDRKLVLPSAKEIQYANHTLNFYETVGPAVLETFHYLDIRNDDYVSSRTDFAITQTGTNPPLGTFETNGSRELYFNDTLIWQGPDTTWESLDYNEGFAPEAGFIPNTRFVPLYAPVGFTAREEIHHAAFGTHLAHRTIGSTTIDILTQHTVGTFELSVGYKGVGNGVYVDTAGFQLADVYDIGPSFNIDTGLGIFSGSSETLVGVGFASYKGEYIVNVSQIKYLSVNDVSANPVDIADDAFFVSYSTLDLEALTTVTPLRKNLFPVGVV